MQKSDTSKSTQEILKTIKNALELEETDILGQHLAMLAGSEPKRWLTLLFLNNVIPEPDNKQFEGVAITLLKGFAEALQNNLFPPNSISKIFLPLFSLHLCFTSISQKLDGLDVWEKPAIRLIFRFAAFVEEQTHLMIEHADEKVYKRGYYNLTDLFSDTIPTMIGGPDTNVVAGHEALSEDLQLVLAYALFKFQADFFGDIGNCKSPYDDADFAQLLALSSIWRRYKYLWSNIKYFGWEPHTLPELEEVIIYHPLDHEEFIRFEVGAIRMQEIRSEFVTQFLSSTDPKIFTDKLELLNSIATSITIPEIGVIWDGCIDINGFKQAITYSMDTVIGEDTINLFHYEKLTSSVTLGTGQRQVSWNKYWKIINVLKLLGKIILIAVNKQILGYDEKSALRRILIVRKTQLASSISDVVDVEIKEVLKTLDLLTFNPKLTHLEIWDTPLIKVDDDLLLFVPSIVVNGSPVRAVENFIAQWNEGLFAKRGKLLESEIKDSLLENGVPVQQDVNFKSSNGDDTQCDLIIWWDEFLLLVEAKCTKAIFAPSDAYRARNQIEYAIKQLNLRRERIIENWDEFRAAANKLNLPDTQPPLENIKLIAVTNVLHFTSWFNQDVVVTDEFCIRRFFGHPDVEAFYGEEVIGVVGRIRQSDTPTAKEFLDYLADPLQVSFVKGRLKFEPLLMPLVEEENPKIAILHANYVAPEFDLPVPNVSKESEVNRKIPRNSPCTCGSGLKYKRCCGKR